MENKMLSITDGEALKCALRLPIDARLKRLLKLRRDQLGGDITDEAHFAIVQPADTAADLERTIGFSVFQNPADDSRVGEPEFTPGCEWIQDHGYCFELCFIFDDSGFAYVVVVPKVEHIDPDLIAFCSTYAIEHAGSADRSRRTR
jgi:hypothetical protein